MAAKPRCHPCMRHVNIDASLTGIDAEYQQHKDYAALQKRASEGQQPVIVLTSDRKLVSTRAMGGLPWLWLSAHHPKEQVITICTFLLSVF